MQDISSSAPVSDHDPGVAESVNQNDPVPASTCWSVWLIMLSQKEQTVNSKEDNVILLKQFFIWVV